MTEKTMWFELSSLPETGSYLVLDARNGSKWVASYDGKPWKFNATHWSELPSSDDVCKRWKEDYIRDFGEISYNQLMRDYAK